MKTKVLSILCLFIVIAAGAGSATSFNGDVSFLRAHRQAKGVEVSWGITDFTGVAGFIVERTYQDPSDPYSIWETISSQSCNPSKSFKCDDENVYPGYLAYRVKTVMSNGSVTVSPITIVHIMARNQ